jgi:hypothetical protein
MKRLFLVLPLLISAQAAEAGAWTLPEDGWQIVSEYSYSRAAYQFGSPWPVAFGKLFLKDNCEYGLTDGVTLIVAPQYVMAVSRTDDADYYARSFTLEAGARALLYDDAGVLSLQASYKTEGAFAQTVSDGRTQAQQIELRLSYGTGFELFGKDGFADIEAAWRLIGRPHPNEIVADATLGLWLTEKDQLLLQSFNIVSAGEVQPPFTAYTLFKAELSMVHKLSRRWSLQSGLFVTYAGSDVVAEHGMTVSAWLSL